MVPSKSDPTGSSAIKEIASNLIPIPSSHEHVFLMIPFDPVAAEGDRSVFLASGIAGASISREPIVEEEAIPATQVEPIALVECEH
jgi:hypothetical protein